MEKKSSRAQKANHDFSTGLTYTVFDNNGNLIYWEHQFGGWEESRFDKNNNLIFSTDSYGIEKRMKYDNNNNLIFSEMITVFEKSNKSWKKIEQIHLMG